MEYKNYFGEGITKGLRARRISDWKAQGVLLKKNQTYKELHNIQILLTVKRVTYYLKQGEGQIRDRRKLESA